MLDQVYSPTHYAADEAAGVSELLGIPVHLCWIEGPFGLLKLDWNWLKNTIFAEMLWEKNTITAEKKVE